VSEFHRLSTKHSRGIIKILLGWSPATELDQAPGMKRDHGKQAELQRDSSAQEQEGLRGLHVGTKEKEAGHREVKGS